MRFNKIKIGSIWLTKDGTENSTPCKLTVTNIDLLLMDLTGQVNPSADGTPFVQVVDLEKRGIILEITVETMLKAVYESLASQLNARLNDGNTIALEITGDTGNFELDSLPMLPRPISPASFINNRIKSTVIRLITT